jgi:hypothetical protein
MTDWCLGCGLAATGIKLCASTFVIRRSFCA